jgi:hypothetical protein
VERTAAKFAGWRVQGADGIMNRPPQSVVHPDADSLSAFAEQALSEAERTRMVAHLAQCARCREVVFLAQTAAEVETPAAVRTDGATSVAGKAVISEGAVSTSPRSGFRFPSLWLAQSWAMLIPAAALAAGAALVFWVEKQPAEAPVEPAQIQSQRAEAGAQRSGLEEQKLAVQAPVDRNSIGEAGSAVRSAENTRAPKDKAPAEPEEIAKGVPAAKSAPLPAVLVTQNQAVEMVRPQQASAAQGGPRPMQGGITLPSLSAAPSAPIPPKQGLSGAAWKPQKPLSPAAATVHSNLDRWTPDGAPSAREGTGPDFHGVTPAQTASTAGLEGFSRQRRLMAPPNPQMQIYAMSKLMSVLLPDGQMSVATATLRDRKLALDPQGLVYLSADAGKNWEAVTPTWEGKVLTLGTNQSHPLLFTAVGEAPAGTNEPPVLQPSPSGNDATEDSATQHAATPAAAHAAAAQQAKTPLFKLATDRGETWVSADGKSWRRQ